MWVGFPIPSLTPVIVKWLRKKSIIFRNIGILIEFGCFCQVFFFETLPKRVYWRFWRLKRYNYSVTDVFCQMFFLRWGALTLIFFTKPDSSTRARILAETPKQKLPRQLWWEVCSLTNCKHIFGCYYYILKFGQFLRNKHAAPTGLSCPGDAVSIDIPPLRGCVSVHQRLFFRELRLCLYHSENPRIWWKQSLICIETVQTLFYRHITPTGWGKRLKRFLKWAKPVSSNLGYILYMEKTSLLQRSNMSIEADGIHSRTPAECYVRTP